MTRNLLIVTGGSSGIGLALARTAPFEARTIDVSRSGGEGLEHFEADLADPASWPRVAEFFTRALTGFDGERAVFVHSAGTLEPIGFAGEVEPADYTRQVLLNSAAPLVLGDAFLRAAGKTEARCDIIMIGSGAASSVYEGWSAYCAGKAGVDHWVRTVGAEQHRRGDRCRVASVAPGIVATPMQEHIRSVHPDQFPEHERFVDLHESGSLRDPSEVGREIWALIGRGLENGAVVDLRDG